MDVVWLPSCSYSSWILTGNFNARALYLQRRELVADLKYPGEISRPPGNFPYFESLWCSSEIPEKFPPNNGLIAVPNELLRHHETLPTHVPSWRADRSGRCAMKVKDVMTTELFFCAGSDTVLSAAWMMKERSVGSLPIVADLQSRRLEGVVTDRDLCCGILAEGKDPATTPVEEVMTPDPIACGPEDELDTCADIMRKYQIRRVPVIDNRARCIGMVAQADLALRANPEQVYKTLAEISRR
jgi:CBS domain-containing protein